LSDIINSIKEAFAEIMLVIGLLDLLVNLQSIINLSNLYSSGQININEYLVRFIFQMVIIPAIPSVLIGLLIHWIREKWGS
jgi:hypothetical protein